MTIFRPEPRRALPAALVLALAATSGCGTAPRPEPVGRINMLPERPSVWADPGEKVASHATKCVVRTVLLPMNRPTEVAWSILDEAVLPQLSRAVWNANGLRLGVLKAKDANDFGAALGTPDRFTDQTLVVINLPTVLRESPKLEAVFFADLTRPPAPPSIETFTGHKARMLISARPSSGGAAVTLTPQHFVPRATLLARKPLEKLLDGRVFEELAARVEIGPGQALVLGYGLPAALRPPLPPEPDADDAPAPETDADAETPRRQTWTSTPRRCRWTWAAPCSPPVTRRVSSSGCSCSRSSRRASAPSSLRVRVRSTGQTARERRAAGWIRKRTSGAP